jgi:hypothetical protein
VRWLAVLLVAWGAWVNVALATWVQNLKEPGFTELRYRLDDALFGGAPPSVIDLVPEAGVPRDGVVAIDGNCAGLYIAEQGHWVPLELADGFRRLSGTATLADGPQSVTTIDGSIELSGTGGSATVAYRPTAGEAVIGAPVPVGQGPVALVIESDPVTGQLTVTLDGRQALFAFAAPDLVDAAASAGIEIVASPSTAICDDLQARR